MMSKAKKCKRKRNQ